jgi:hypothetical protein
MHDPETALCLCFGGESLTALTAARERKTGWRVRLGISWYASLVRRFDLTTMLFDASHSMLPLYAIRQIIGSKF